MAGGTTTGAGPPTTGGIYASRWTTIQFPASAIVLTLQDGEPKVEVQRVEVSLDVWPHWLEIGLQHSKDAGRAHQSLLSALAAEDQPGVHDALESELRLAMQATSAAAFVLDALGISIASRHVVPKNVTDAWAANRTCRAARVCYLIQSVGRVSNAQMKLLRRTVGSAFSFRNWAVHPPADFHRPLLHPDVGAGVDWRFVAFSASNAERACAAALEGLLRTFEHPRRPELEEWTVAQKDVLDTILAEHNVTLRSA